MILRYFKNFDDTYSIKIHSRKDWDKISVVRKVVHVLYLVRINTASLHLKTT